MNLQYLMNVRDIIQMFLFYEQHKKYEDNDKSLLKEIKSKETTIGRKIYLLEQKKHLDFKYETLLKFMKSTLVNFEDELKISLYKLAKLIVKNEMYDLGYRLSDYYIELPNEILYSIFMKDKLNGFDREKSVYVYDESRKKDVEVEGDTIKVYLKWGL